MTSQRHWLYATVLAVGLIWPGAAGRTAQAQDGNSDKSSTVSSRRKKALSRRARQNRRRRAASKPVVTKDDLPVIPPVRPQPENQKLPTVPTLEVDPSLFPPQKINEIGTGSGSGTGVGTGDGLGRVSNTGGGNSDAIKNDGAGSVGGVDGGRIFAARDVDRKAMLLSRPQPMMTEAARKNNTGGVVTLRAVLAASGEVTNIRVIKGLPDGLSERAVEAARRIRFRPAVKDGRTVSQYISLEYTFSHY